MATCEWVVGRVVGSWSDSAYCLAKREVGMRGSINFVPFESDVKDKVYRNGVLIGSIQQIGGVLSFRIVGATELQCIDLREIADRLEKLDSTKELE